MQTDLNHHCIIRAVPKGEYPQCTACGGRIHDTRCTTPRDILKDCCERRHEKLISLGFTKGIYDTSTPMEGTHAI